MAYEKSSGFNLYIKLPMFCKVVWNPWKCAYMLP